MLRSVVTSERFEYHVVLVDASLDLINSVVTRRRIILLSFRRNSRRNPVVAAGQKFAITILNRS